MNDKIYICTNLNQNISHQDIFGIQQESRHNEDMPTWRWPLTSPLSSSRLANKPARRSYHAGPKQFGRYPLLPSSMAITSYPDPLHVPEHISRPNYVPRNFFSAPIWEHEAVSSSPSASEGDRIKLGTQYEVDIRKAGKMASEVLNEIGKLVLVSRLIQIFLIC